MWKKSGLFSDNSLNFFKNFQIRFNKTKIYEAIQCSGC
jgi:hypothetical protein